MYGLNTFIQSRRNIIFEPSNSARAWLCSVGGHPVVHSKEALSQTRSVHAAQEHFTLGSSPPLSFTVMAEDPMMSELP